MYFGILNRSLSFKMNLSDREECECINKALNVSKEVSKYLIDKLADEGISGPFHIISLLRLISNGAKLVESFCKFVDIIPCV